MYGLEDNEEDQEIYASFRTSNSNSKVKEATRDIFKNKRPYSRKISTGSVNINPNCNVKENDHKISNPFETASRDNVPVTNTITQKKNNRSKVPLEIQNPSIKTNTESEIKHPVNNTSINTNNTVNEDKIKKDVLATTKELSFIFNSTNSVPNVSISQNKKSTKVPLEIKDPVIKTTITESEIKGHVSNASTNNNNSNSNKIERDIVMLSELNVQSKLPLDSNNTEFNGNTNPLFHPMPINNRSDLLNYANQLAINQNAILNQQNAARRYGGTIPASFNQLYQLNGQQYINQVNMNRDRQQLYENNKLILVEKMFSFIMALLRNQQPPTQDVINQMKAYLDLLTQF